MAEYLFTKGVEQHHCDVFRGQEISGEVLLGMDQSSLFIKDLNLGSVGRRLKMWQKIKSLQDEISGEEPKVERSTHARLSDVRSQDVKRTRNPEQDSTRVNSASMAESIDTLTKQPTTYKEEPGVYNPAQSFTAM